MTTPARCLGAALLAAALLPAGARPEAVNAVVQEASRGAADAAAAQERIDAVADDTDAMAAEYRATLEQTRALGVYAEQLGQLVDSQRGEIARLQADVERATIVGREVMPLMARMVDAYEAFVALDLPFLPDERQRRIRELHALLPRADVTISEKYRRLLEAFQAENEYGRTLEAYRGTLHAGEPAERTVDFLRVGRIGLFYRTLDGAECGRWNPATKAWEPLDGYRGAIETGIAMARKQIAPELLELPVPAPEAAE